MLRLHATAVALGPHGVLIRGPSGAGKSSLALALIDAPGFGLHNELQRAHLIADDQVELAPHETGLIMSPHETLRGKLEIRGLGIMQTSFLAGIPLRLIVDLVPPGTSERLPETQALQAEIASRTFPRFVLEQNSPTAPARVRAALSLLVAQEPAPA